MQKKIQNNVKPKEAIQQLIDNYSKTYTINQCTGLHIRMGQDAAKNIYEDNSKYNSEKKTAMDLARNQSHYKWRQNILLVKLHLSVPYNVLTIR